MENGIDRFRVRKTPFEKNGESEPLVYATSPTEVSTSLWNEDKRVPDILNDLKNGNKKTGGNQLPTLTGVYCPTIQNIFGVILFIRMSWIVGVCGFLEAFLLVLICCCTTLLTAFSMSAVATNGQIASGGSYYMISRNLGPAFGGSVGILFYLGTTFAASMYILGAIEIITKYIAPGMSLNLGSEDGFFSVMFNDGRIYGTIFLICMVTIVYVGVKYVNYSANIFLCITLISITSIYAGFVTNAVSPKTSPEDTRVCLLGPQLLKQPQDKRCSKTYQDSNQTYHPTWLYEQFCPNTSVPKTPSELSDFSSLVESGGKAYLDDCHPFFQTLSLTEKIPIPGINNGEGWKKNLKSGYMEKGEYVRASGFAPNDYILLNNATADDLLPEKTRRSLWISADITSSFAILIGIFFPSCTGIMAGSNRSGDLANPGRSIPKGTIAAILTTSIVYLSCVILFGLSVEGEILRDKFGESLSDNNALLTAKIVWPHQMVMLVGCLLSTCGAGLQSLTGAPRLLQSIAKDGIIPFLDPCAKGKPLTDEPTWSILFTAIICEFGILIADLDKYVAPFATLFFLMCYLFVNVACVLQSFLKAPSWRPKWQYYHCSLSFLGAILCLMLMWMVGWQLVLVVAVIAVSLYKYIVYKGAEKEWGDGIRGLYLTTARYALYQIPDSDIHTKNYRPQLLVFCQFNEKKEIVNSEIISIARHLKAGKGLSMFAAVIEGNFLEPENRQNLEVYETVLKEKMAEGKCKGFTNILMQEDVGNGIASLIQTSGLGGLKHNSVLISWPDDWKSNGRKPTNEFLHSIRTANALDLACVVPKIEAEWPTEKNSTSGRTIDIWWIIHDGGLIILLGWLLKQNPVWKNCRLRLFAVAEETDNSIKMEAELRQHLDRLRIEISHIRVVELTKQDISAYAYERTMKMEERCELLKQMGTEDIGSIAEAARSTTNASLKNIHNIADSTMTWSPTHNSNRNNPESKLEKPVNAEKMRVQLTNANGNFRKMHNAISLNGCITTESHSAELVVVNMPPPPSTTDAVREISYMEFIEALTQGVDRVLLVRGGGHEVVTAYG